MSNTPQSDWSIISFDGGGGGELGAGERGEGALGGGGGGAGGADVGELDPDAAARMAACTAIFGDTGLGAEGGGGGGCDLDGGGGSRGADVDGGGGGGAGGKDGAAEDGGGGGGGAGELGTDGAAMLWDGFRELGGGGGFFPTGGGGPFTEADECGRGTSLCPVFLRLAIDGWFAKPGIVGRPGIAGAAPGGGLGAEAVGGFGAEDRDDSGSDKYDASRFAGYRLESHEETQRLGNSSIPPVSTPAPVFLNFGIPAANKPPNWGAASTGAAGTSRLACSLLLLALFPGAGGARPAGGLDMPGTGGAPPKGDGPGPPDTFPTIGADRSFLLLRAVALGVRQEVVEGAEEVLQQLPAEEEEGAEEVVAS
ncbi:hypothetical protein VP1G_11173 [Cytospora mali]|uniref:Uncharacterized protein n=1 Tax=Cytospora mali TaxID=578113 RepID=A0A194V8X1_CYTMA|nr:hypothetical protein VP1G_11173 [Valsa mali var. pyri (nom. inval.)]